MNKKIDNPLEVFGQTLDKFYETSYNQAKDRYEEYTNNSSLFVQRVANYFKADTWLIDREAIPLLMGVIPTDWPSLRKDFYTEDVKKCIKSDYLTSLKVLNPEAKLSDWRIKKEDFIDWVEAKEFPKPRVFSGAIKEYLQKASTSHIKPRKAKKYSEDRELMFRAVVAVLVKFPEQCKTAGKVSAPKVAKVIDEKSLIWWPDGEIPFNQQTMARHIRDAISTLE